MLDTLAVANYRSLRHLVVPLRRCTIVTGPNGSGKSSLYRSLRLLSDMARNGAVSRALARGGGPASTMWAGPGRPGPVSLKLGFAGDDLGYAVDLGMPQIGGTLFGGPGDQVRRCGWGLASAVGADRRPRWPPTARVPRRRRKLAHRFHRVAALRQHAQRIADPREAVELLALRERMRSWRFYDHVRTDSAAPARAARIGTRTTVLGHDGADLAAAWQTIVEIGDARALAESVDAAFPGSRVEITLRDGLFELALRQPG